MFHNTIKAFFTIGLLVNATGRLMAQQQVQPVSYTIEAPETVEAGAVFTVSAVFDIQPNWYVYAPIPMNAAQGKIPTRISFVPHKRLRFLGDLELPDESKGYDRYSGKDVRMSQRFQVPKDMALGEQAIRATVTYQTCSNNICYPPVEEEITIEITVEQPNK